MNKLWLNYTYIPPWGTHFTYGIIFFQCIKCNAHRGFRKLKKIQKTKTIRYLAAKFENAMGIFVLFQKHLIIKAPWGHNMLLETNETWGLWDVHEKCAFVLPKLIFYINRHIKLHIKLIKIEN